MSPELGVYLSIFFGFVSILLVLIFYSPKIKQIAKRNEKKLMAEINNYKGKIDGKKVEEWSNSIQEVRQPILWLEWTIKLFAIVSIVSIISCLVPIISRLVFVIGSGEYLNVVNLVIVVGGALGFINLFSLGYWYWKLE